MEGDYIPLQQPGNLLTCWGHIGHFHYFVGQDRVYGLQSGSAGLVSVEQHFSPSVNVGVSTAQGAALVHKIPIETSMDGVTWKEVATANYRLVSVDTTGDPTLLCLPLLSPPNTNNPICKTINQNFPLCSDGVNCNWRQYILVSFQGEGQEFRFLRAHNPVSATVGGLSGFLDYSWFELDVTDLRPADPIELTPQVGVQKDCTTDLMESINPDHPCWFGGASQAQLGLPTSLIGGFGPGVANGPGHWDSASYFHTYPLGDSLLGRVKDSYAIADWRVDAPPVNKKVLIQTSADGVHWDTIGTVNSALSSGSNVVQNAFDVQNLEGKPAKFVRLVSDKQTNWANGGGNRHPWGYLIDSSLELSGSLPA